MPVPDYQAFMLPVMRIISDCKEHAVADIHAQIISEMGFTDNDLAETIPSGTQTKIYNRLNWAITYMKKAGLLIRTGRARIKITDRGKKLMSQKPSKIDNAVLLAFKEFKEFRKREPRSTTVAKVEVEEDQTPEEVMHESHERLTLDLVEQILDRLKECTPAQFERHVLNMLVAMGYGGSREDAFAVGRSGDGGIDGIIKQDKLGLDKVYVQAKKWEGTVPVESLRGFAGSLDIHGATKGVFITTSQFSKSGIEQLAKASKNIVLIDGERLAQLMIEHDIGVTEVARYALKRIDEDYFEENL
jgi:restriction system protein